MPRSEPFLESGARAPAEQGEQDGGFSAFAGFLASGSVSGPPNAELAKLWARYGDAVLEAWIEEKPGSRPWAFWATHVPEEEERPGRGRELAYLRRHGLLLPGEAEAARERKRDGRESEASEASAE